MINFFLKNKLKIALVFAGLVAGFLYWRFAGCNSGSCSLTSNWHYSTFFGGLIGYFVADSILDKKKKKMENSSL